MKIKLGLLTLLVCMFCIPGCAAWPVLRTIDDLARLHCARYFSGVKGISAEDAFEAYCKTREAWAPWIDPVIRAQQEGEAIVEGQKASNEEPSETEE